MGGRWKEMRNGHPGKGGGRRGGMPVPTTQIGGMNAHNGHFDWHVAPFRPCAAMSKGDGRGVVGADPQALRRPAVRSNCGSHVGCRPTSEYVDLPSGVANGANTIDLLVFMDAKDSTWLRATPLFPGQPLCVLLYVEYLLGRDGCPPLFACPRRYQSAAWQDRAASRFSRYRMYVLVTGRS